MTSLSSQTVIQKNEAKLSSFVQFENEKASYPPCSITEQCTTLYVLTPVSAKLGRGVSELLTVGPKNIMFGKSRGQKIPKNIS